MHPSTFLNNCKVSIWPATYAVLQTDTVPKDFVAVIKDHNELSVIIDNQQLDQTPYLKAEDNWKILTFEAVLPFELVGFLAAVAKVLADAKISIFALSAYSTDHIMVKADKLTETKEVLEKLGCIF